MPWQQSSQLGWPQQRIKTLDLAVPVPSPPQTQATEVNAVYAEMVDKMRSIVEKLEKEGNSVKLDAELEEQRYVMVCHPACCSLTTCCLSAQDIPGRLVEQVCIRDMLACQLCHDTARKDHMTMAALLVQALDRHVACQQTPTACNEAQSIALQCTAFITVMWPSDVQGQFIKGTILNNSDNLRKLYMVNIDPENWDDGDLLYRTPEHWQAVTVSTLAHRTHLCRTVV